MRQDLRPCREHSCRGCRATRYASPGRRGRCWRLAWSNRFGELPEAAGVHTVGKDDVAERAGPPAICLVIAVTKRLQRLAEAGRGRKYQETYLAAPGTAIAGEQCLPLAGKRHHRSMDEGKAGCGEIGHIGARHGLGEMQRGAGFAPRRLRATSRGAPARSARATSPRDYDRRSRPKAIRL